jgi:hypothetical protein
MRTNSISRFATAAGALWALGFVGSCSSADASSGSFPETPYSLTTTASGKLAIALSTAPSQPPNAGVDAVELILTDPTTGKPIDGETITLVPWMPLMGHGTDMIPEVQPMGNGRYVVRDVNLYMPGEWLLTFAFSGKVTESAWKITFDVP